MTRSHIAAALGALLAISIGHPAGAKGGGGGHVVVVPIISYANPNERTYNGLESVIDLEVTSDPPIAMEGDFHLGDVIAQHTVRAVDAIVTLAPLKGLQRDIPIGTPLVLMRFPTPQKLAAWCDLRPQTPHFLANIREHDCFVDKSGTGKLDELWEGDSPVHFLGFSKSGVGAPVHPVEQPAAYRKARPDERPTAIIGYRYCDGDGETGPPRFAIAAKIADDPSWILVGACRFGVRETLGDRSKVDLAGLKLDVTPLPGGGVHLRVIGRLAPGPIATLQPDETFRPRSDQATDAVSLKETAERLARKVLETDGPTNVHVGDIGVGQEVWNRMLKFGITGVLQNPVWIAKTQSHLDPGQAMFGIPVRVIGSDDTIWCAPRRTEKGYLSVCLVPAPYGYQWVEDSVSALAPSPVLGWGSSVNSDPTVRPGPVSLPTIQLVLHITKITPRAAGGLSLEIERSLDWGEGPKKPQRGTLQIGPEGLIQEFDGVKYWLAPTPDGQHLHVERAAKGATGAPSSGTPANTPLN